jgi:Protein of unknown function (DUF4239)
MYFLTTKPLWLTALVVIVLPTVLAMAAPPLLRRRVSLERLRVNNEVAGFKFAVVGVIYAVLLAFAVIVVWERFHQAEMTVAQEGGAAATIYRLVDGMSPENRAAMRSAVTSYLQAAVDNDWPAMTRGADSPKVTESLGTLYRTALTFIPRDERDHALLGEIFYQLDQITQARATRLVLATGNVPGVLWAVLFIGAFVTVSFTLFFGTENVRAQTVMTGALSVLILSGLYVIIVIDRPFAGPVQVNPEALIRVIDDFGGPPR